jgi:serine/threonine-protein kinase RsbW
MPRLRIDAASESLADVRRFVRSAALAEGADEGTVADLVQAVDEAVTNVVVHGYSGRGGPIEVDLVARDGALVARVVDAAPRFDPTGLEPPKLDASLRNRRPGGMGVHLMRSMSDEMRHRTRPEGGNELTLVKRIGTKV